MWRLVREGLRVYRPVLLVAWSLAAVGVLFVFTTLVHVGVLLPDRAVFWASAALPMYVLLASAIPGWIALGTDSQEKRVHLHLLLPVSPREFAVARHLLPVSMLAIGLPLAHVLNAAAMALNRAALNDTRTPWLSHARLDLVAAYLLFFIALSFAYEEAAALWEKSRLLSLAASLAVSFLCVVVVLGLHPLEAFRAKAMAVTAISILLSAAAIALYCRRLRG